MAANQVRLDDGFATLITLANIPTVKIFEKEVTPPGISGGGPIDTTTMRNTAWRTQSPKQLKTLTAVSATVAYATEALDVIRAQINVNQEITIHYPDGSTDVFWGYLDEFTPSAHVEGEQPTATLSIQPTNHDNDEPYNEVAPLYTEPAVSGESV